MTSEYLYKFYFTCIKTKTVTQWSREQSDSNMFELICLFMLVMMIAYYGYEEPNRHGSFAPIRENSQAAWYVDGKDYMSAVADAIEQAESEILITDWQMNPEIFMKRPDSGVDDMYWRLDKMLLRKAEAKVKVYILLYWEMKKVFDLGSDHVVDLFAKHENIFVYRHPDSVSGARNLFRWSHHEKIVIVDQSIAFVGGIDLCYGRWDTRKHELMDHFLVHSAAVDENESPPGESHENCARWIGKDYRNTFYNKEKRTDWDNLLEGYEGVERYHVPRMPWHDVSCAFTGDAVQDAVKHFNDRYNTLINSWWQTYWDSFRQYFQNTNLVKKLLPSKRISKVEKIVSDGKRFNVKIQFLRSVSEWSAGQKREASIYNAYIDAIKKAKHFIYIESQFFISSQEGFWRSVQNKIQGALVERIVRAHKANEDFHVMVITPLKPEIGGTLDGTDWNSDALQAVTYWNQATIYQGKDSLFSKLEKENISKEAAMEYFSVFSLRTYDLIGDHFVTEIVYVHSKIMIVDDRFAIIGSANINDRSMLGDRDSEVAVVIEDMEFIDGRMNGVEYKMGKFAHSLRCDLLREHLGLLETGEGEFDVSDPLDKSFIFGVYARAESNTIIFKNEFGAGWSHGEKNTEDSEALKRRHKDTPLLLDSLKEIKGNIVNYPCLFLHGQANSLKPSVLDFSNMYVNHQPVQQYGARYAYA